MFKRYVVVLLVLSCSLGLSVATAGAFSRPFATPSSALSYVPGELLVEFHAGVTSREVRDAVRSADAQVVRDLPGTGRAPGGGLVLVRSASHTTHDLAAAFGRSSNVAKTSPNYIRRVDAVPPNDPGLAGQWGLFQIQAPQAWETSVGSSDVVVASVDTGVDYLHPDLVANMWRNPGEIPGDGVDDDGNGYIDDVYGINSVDHTSVPMDDYGHGTHTAGIMAAVGDNAVGVAGVGWHTRIMALKSFSVLGWGTDASAIECIDYGVREKLDHGVNVVAINASWGWTKPSPFLRDAIDNAGAAGIVFCASAGNSHENNDRRPCYPAAFACENIIAVAATNTHDTLASFSNWGPTSVDLGAPGVAVLSTLPRSMSLPRSVFDPPDPESMYGSWSGTSMAAPFVTGAVAVCAAEHPGESLRRRIARILSSVRPVPGLRGRCVTAGRLDLSAALGEGAPGGDVNPPHTLVLGTDDSWHDVPVRVRLFAGDGAGGSGVASTKWRLDGGAWKRSTAVFVAAPPKTRVVRIVDYRSRDKAGNVEALQSCQVKIDTTGPDDGEIPGLPLPASPFSGGVWKGSDADDVFRLTLDQGESLSAVVGGAPGAQARLRLYPPGTRRLSWGRPVAVSRSSTAGGVLAYCAETSGEYYLDVRAAGRAGFFEVTAGVYPPGVDVTPPDVVVDDRGYGDDWMNRPVTLAFLADDGLFGSGVSAIESSMDGGETWTPGAHAVVPAPADHSNDGLHLVRYRAHDYSGNVSPESWYLAWIDTAGPSTETWGPRGAVRRGDTARVRFKVIDTSGEARLQVVVRSVASGATVQIANLGWRRARSPLLPSPSIQTFHLPCTMRRGAYRLLIAGTTHDGAGNLWESAVCHRWLRVR